MRNTFPFEFTDFATGRFIARRYYRVHDDMYDVIERDAEHFADMNDVEIDIIGCAVMPSGKIGGRERCGIRVRPSWWPDVIETDHGPVCCN
jgi:hypothetical protein